MPQPSQPNGTYDFGPLGKVKGLKINGQYATEQQAREWLMRNRMNLVADNRPAPPTTGPTAFAERALGTIQGIGSLLPDPMNDFEHPQDAVTRLSAIPVGLAQSEGKLGSRFMSQLRDKDPRALFTLLAMNPFSAQTIDTMSEQYDQGNVSAARGTGVFDVLTLLSGARLKDNINRLRGKPEFPPQVNYLARATGSDPADIVKVTDELNATARSKGRPNTVPAYNQTITEAKTTVDNKFNQLLHPIRTMQVIPYDIARKLMAESQKPNLLMTPEGRVEMTKLRRAAILYQTPWTLEALNEERVRVSAQRQSFYNKTTERQGAALRSSVDEKIDSIVEEGLKDAVYDTMEKHYANTSNAANIRELKQKQSVLMRLESEAKEAAKQQRTAQAVHRGSSLTERLKASVYGHPTGRLGVSFHGLQGVMDSGPATGANKAVNKAFPSPLRKLARGARRTAAVTLPLAPKDREKSLRSQLVVAEKVSKEWAARIRKLLGEEQ